MTSRTFLTTVARAYLKNARPEVASSGTIQATQMDGILGACSNHAKEADLTELIAITEAEALPLALEISDETLMTECGGARLPPIENQLRESLARLIGSIPSLTRARFRRPGCPNGHGVPSGFSLGDPLLLKEILPRRVPSRRAGDQVDLYDLICILEISDSTETWLAELPGAPGRRVTLKLLLADALASPDNPCNILDQIEFADWFAAFGSDLPRDPPPLPLLLDRGQIGQTPYIVADLDGYFPLGNLRQGIDGGESLPSREVLPALLDSMNTLHRLGMRLAAPGPGSVLVADGTLGKHPGALFDISCVAKAKDLGKENTIRILAGTLLGQDPDKTKPIDLLIGLHSSLGFPVLGFQKMAKSIAVCVEAANWAFLRDLLREVILSRGGSCPDNESVISDAWLKQLRYRCGFDGKQMASFARAFLSPCADIGRILACGLLGPGFPEDADPWKLLGWLNIHLGFPPAVLSCFGRLMGFRVDAPLQARFRELAGLVIEHVPGLAERLDEAPGDDGILRLLRDSGRFTPEQLGEFAVSLAIPEPGTASSVACALLGIDPPDGDQRQILRMLFSQVGLNPNVLSALAHAIGIHKDPGLQNACRTIVIGICRNLAHNPIHADELKTEDGLLRFLKATGNFDRDQLELFAEALCFPSKETARNMAELLLGVPQGEIAPRQLLARLCVEHHFPIGVLSAFASAMWLKVDEANQSLFRGLISGAFRDLSGMGEAGGPVVGDILRMLRDSGRFTQQQLGTFAEAIHFPTQGSLDGLWRRLGNNLLRPGGPNAEADGWPSSGSPVELISFLHEKSRLDWEILTRLAGVLGLDLEKGQAGAYLFARKAGDILSITLSNNLGRGNFTSRIVFCWVPPGECRVGGTKGTPGPNSFQARRGFWCSKQVLSYRQLCSIFGGSGIEGQLAVSPVRNILLRAPVIRGQPPQFLYAESTANVQRQFFDHPVSMLTELAVNSILQKLNAGASYEDDGPKLRYRFRIPSSNEWEYILRGGGLCPSDGHDFYIRHNSFAGPAGATNPAYSSELTNEIMEQINLNQTNGPEGDRKLRGTTDPSSFSNITNGLGIVGMHGNTWEWTQDLQVLNGIILRGGCHSSRPEEARASAWKPLQQFRPDNQGRYRDVGIRLLAEPIFPPSTA